MSAASLFQKRALMSAASLFQKRALMSAAEGNHFPQGNQYSLPGQHCWRAARSRNKPAGTHRGDQTPWSSSSAIAPQFWRRLFPVLRKRSTFHRTAWKMAGHRGERAWPSHLSSSEQTDQTGSSPDIGTSFQSTLVFPVHEHRQGKHNELP